MKVGDKVRVTVEAEIYDIYNGQVTVKTQGMFAPNVQLLVDEANVEVIADPPKPGQIWVCNDNPRSKIFITEDGNGYHCELNETVYLSDAYVLKVFLLTWHKV